MRISHRSQGAAAIATALLLSAMPAVGQDQNDWADAASDGRRRFEAVLEQGQGTGTITLPTITELGSLMGVLTEEQSGTQHLLKATLTSFLPDGNGAMVVDMGGVYGTLVEVGTPSQNPKASVIEGTWTLETRTGGTINAVVLVTPGLGGARELGRIHGKFLLHPDGKGGSIDLGRPYNDNMGSQPPFDTPFGSASGGKDPARPYNDNRGSQPPFDTPFGSAAGNKTPGGAYNDNRSSQSPFHSPFGSASGGKDPARPYNDNRGSQSPVSDADDSAKAATFDTAASRKRTHPAFDNAEDDTNEPPVAADLMSGVVGFHFVLLNQ